MEEKPGKVKSGKEGITGRGDQGKGIREIEKQGNTETKKDGSMEERI